MSSQNHGPFPSIYIHELPTIRWMASLPIGIPPAPAFFHEVAMKSPELASWFSLPNCWCQCYIFICFWEGQALGNLGICSWKEDVFKVIDEFVVITWYNWLLDAISNPLKTNQGDLDQMSSSTLCCVPRQLFNFGPSRCCWERRSDSGRSVSQSHADSTWWSWS